MGYAKLNAGKLGLAVTLAIIIVWVILAILGWLTGGAMIMSMGGRMGAQMGNEIAVGGGMLIAPFIFAGLVGAIISGIMTWFVASIYNRLI